MCACSARPRGEARQTLPPGHDESAHRIRKAREQIRGVRESLGGRQIPIALTECHFTIPGRDRLNSADAMKTVGKPQPVFHDLQNSG
jgi:hypothetical protein